MSPAVKMGENRIGSCFFIESLQYSIDPGKSRLFKMDYTILFSSMEEGFRETPWKFGMVELMVRTKVALDVDCLFRIRIGSVAKKAFITR